MINKKILSMFMALMIVMTCIVGLVNPSEAYAYTSKIQIVRGSEFTAFLMSDGTVKTTGLNESGQLGIGNTTNQFLPVTISGLTGVKQISAGSFHTLALMNDGTVRAWGSNGRGQLGIGSTITMQLLPVTVPGLTNVSAVIAGAQQSFALMNDGTVMAWGNNNGGYLGIGNTTNQLSPVAIPGLTGVKQLCAGYSHAVVLMTDGTVKAWGSDSSGQLGDGKITAQYLPISVSSLTNVSQLVVWGSTTFALMNDGTVKGWGNNSTGELAIGITDTPQRTPIEIPALAGVKQLLPGVALMRDGSVKSWGSNYNCELGIGNDTTKRLLPVTIPTLINVKKLLAPGFALMNDGTVYCWGSNSKGQLGIGDQSVQTSPVALPNFTGIQQLSVGHGHAVALMDDGTITAWGSYSYSQSGVEIKHPWTPIALNGFSDVKQVAVGGDSTTGDYTLVLMNDGTVKAWGCNNYGQLGVGNKTNQSSPVIIPRLTGVAQIEANVAQSFALMNDGTVKAWGNNYSGQLGTGSTILSESSPVTITGLTGVKQIVCGEVFLWHF